MSGSILAVAIGKPGAGPQFPRAGEQAHCPLPALGPFLTSSVGDGDRHALDLDPVDVNGLHGLGRCGQLGCVQADDAPSRRDLWQRPLFPENCGRVFFAGSALMGSTGRRAATSGGSGGRSCCWGAVLDKDRLHLTVRRPDVDLGGAREKKSVHQDRPRLPLSGQCHLPDRVENWESTQVFSN